MKLTVDNVWHYFIAGQVKILRDGIEYSRVIEADDEEGYIILEQWDENGQPVVKDDEIQTRRLDGKITFEGVRRREG